MSLFLLLFFVSSKNFAVLFAGSNGMWNYRHQADIHTIHKIISNQGYTRDQIKLFVFDDLGQEIYHDISHNQNVYAGKENIDYSGIDVNPKNFYNCLTSLGTTYDDNIFIYYDDHGGVGLLSTPVYEYIHADELRNVLKSLKFKHCFFIIEACYAGSIGNVIKDIPNMITITASRANESSYAANYDDKIKTHLTNEFSYYFINEIKENPFTTIGTLFTNIKNMMRGSTPEIYGDDNLKKLFVSEFLGVPKYVTFCVTENLHQIDITPQRSASEKTMKLLKYYSTGLERSKVHLASMKASTMTQKIDFILNKIIEHLNGDSHENEKYDNEKLTSDYFIVEKYFLSKVKELNCKTLISYEFIFII